MVDLKRHFQHHDSLNFAYQVQEKRSWWKSRLAVAVWLTIVLTVLMFAAIVIVIAGTEAANRLAAQGFGVVAAIWKIVQYPVALFFVVLAFAILYRYGPDVHGQKWHWITPGSLIGVLL